MSLKDYFDYLPGKARCKVGECKTKVNRNDRNTTAMRDHLETKHKDQWKIYEAQKTKAATPKSGGIQ
jgi:hypothetical protein